MAKLPSFQFYPGDWMKDPALRACSDAARGIWIDILCWMFECEKRGYLTTNHKAWSKLQILDALSGKGTHEERMVSLEELIANGVLKQTRNGTFFSARIVRDERQRKEWRGIQDKRKNLPCDHPLGWTAVRVKIIERDRYLCAYCGGLAKTVDHVHPVDKGGTHEARNLVAACHKCNSAKGKKTLVEWGRDFHNSFDRKVLQDPHANINVNSSTSSSSPSSSILSTNPAQKTRVAQDPAERLRRREEKTLRFMREDEVQREIGIGGSRSPSYQA
jgi:hypothetical protein